MIKIIIKPREVTITGHANSAPPGQDLVCCAVSTLYSSLVANLLRDTKQDKNNEVEYNGLKGDAFVKVKKFNTRCYYSFKFFRTAIKHLASEYSEYIQVEDKIDDSKEEHKKM